MIIYPEIKKIAGKLASIRHLADKLAEKTDTEGIEWNTAELVDGLSVKGKYLCKGNERIAEYNDEYYVCQHTGYCEDNFYGNLYFKTNVPGQYVKVYFQM